jgi:hypothetical protein
MGISQRRKLGVLFEFEVGDKIGSERPSVAERILGSTSLTDSPSEDSPKVEGSGSVWPRPRGYAVAILRRPAISRLKDQRYEFIEP